MKKIITYLLLAVFCFNIFGARIGEVIHLLIHSFDGSDYQHHNHRQNQYALLEEAHTHEQILEFLLVTLDFSEDQSVFLFLRDLNLLMLGLLGLIDLSTFQLILPGHISKVSPSENSLKFNHKEVPTPPPRRFL